MNADTDERTVRIAEHLHERTERRIAGTTFGSVDEYVQFVLEEVLAADDDGSYDDVDDDDVQARLRSLGYLDA
ncbi:CopG family transcriptional regulator [Halorubrum sp. 48-1-W]|uniref:CopG family transcriptional regulator n=1 Tax=Halorubrum sp. 48-1-W TaxID=2249761 RepID=UPI000FCCB4D9|nr:CopG family transcriptional regulator [Halorubrum sp. 48-1-W]